MGICLSIDTNRTVAIPGVLSVTAPAYIKDLTVEQTIHGNVLDLTGNATIAHNLETRGTATFKQSMEVNGTLTARNTSGWGNIHCVPSVDGAEAAIGFLKQFDQRVSLTGDAWLIGWNLFNANPDVFSIGLNNVGNCLSIDLFGNTTLKGRLEMTDIINSPQMTDIGSRLNNVANQVNTLTINLSNTQ